MLNLSIKKTVALVSVTMILSACQPDNKNAENQSQADDSKPVKTTAQTATSDIKEEDKIGYALGAKMASFISKDIDGENALNINKDSVAKGFTDALKNEVKMSEQEITEQFNTFQQKMQALQQKKAAEAQAQQAEKDKELLAAGDAFLAENGKKEGVKTTQSGLQYNVVTAAKKGAKKPSATDTVKVHYTGTLIDGKVFDSSIERGEPVSFLLNRVIPGWTEGLQLMGVGSKYHFVIPWKLAYGSAGRPGSIPRHAVLQFDVELLAINPAAEAPAKKEK